MTLSTHEGPERRESERRTVILPHPHTLMEGCPGGCADIDLVNDTISKTKSELLALEARLKESHDQLQRFEARLDEGSARMGRIEALISDNVGAMSRNTTDTSEILQMMRDREAVFRIFEKTGNFLKWAGGIFLPLLLLFYAFRDHSK